MMVMRRARLLGATTCTVNGVAFYFPVVESDEYLSKLRASVMLELKSPDDILTLINDHKNEVCLIHAGTYADFSEVWKVAKLLNANKVPFHFQIMDELVHKVKVGFLK